MSTKTFDFLSLLGAEGGPAGDLADVELRVEDSNGEVKGSIRAHKVILGCISPVFRQMFFGPLQGPTEQGNIPEAKIVAPSFAAFEKMIRYIYSGDKDIASDIKAVMWIWT
jgi:hypothetical protein